HQKHQRPSLGSPSGALRPTCTHQMHHHHTTLAHHLTHVAGAPAVPLRGQRYDQLPGERHAAALCSWNKLQLTPGDCAPHRRRRPPLPKVKRSRPRPRPTFVTTVLGAGVGLRDVQIAAGHADPRTTMRYDRTCKNLDRHLSYVLAAYMASGIWRSSASPAHNP